MSRLVSRILLAVFMLPAATMVYILMFLMADHGSVHKEAMAFVFAGGVTWAGVASYWVLLWRGGVQWTPQRIGFTFLAGGVSLAVGAILGAIAEGVMRYSNGSFGCFFGSVVAIVVWLILTVFIWRETPAERRSRIGSVNKVALVCPHCGYNLTGLTATRCPECGTQFTLDELVALQPQNAEVEIEA